MLTVLLVVPVVIVVLAVVLDLTKSRHLDGHNADSVREPNTSEDPGGRE
jgi:hypothetical protein